MGEETTETQSAGAARVERAITRLGAALLIPLGLIVSASLVGPLLVERLAGAIGREPRGGWAALLSNVIVAAINLAVIAGALRAYRGADQPGRRGNVQLWLLIATAILLVGGLAYVGEVTLRCRAAADGGETLFRCIRLKQRPPGQDIEVVPSDEVLSITDSLAKRPYRMRTDADGYILPGDHDADADFTVVFLGGSTTECAFVEEDRRFPYLVGRRLAADTGATVASYNSGVSGNTTMHSVNLLLNKAAALEPDAAVLMHNINDAITLLYTGTYWNEHPTRSLIETRTIRSARPAVPEWGPIVFPRTALWIAERVEAAGADERADEWAGYRAALALEPESIERRFVAALETFVGVCRAWEIEPVLMTQAARMPAEPENHVQQAYIEAIGKGFDAERISYADLRALHLRLNEAVRRVGRRRDVRVIDLAGQIPADAEHMYDIVHLTAAGSQRAAEIIAGDLAGSIDVAR